MHYTGMMAARYESDESVQVSDAATMSGDQAFISGILVAACVIATVAIASLAELRYSVWRLSYELNRADETITTLPTNNSNACASQIRRYVHKRKASHFSLGVINNTYAMDHDDEEDDNASVSSNRSWTFTRIKPGSGTLSHSPQVHPTEDGQSSPMPGSAEVSVNGYTVHRGERKGSAPLAVTATDASAGASNVMSFDAADGAV
jgi:hypothetical protein